jgi:hypothetical protein
MKILAHLRALSLTSLATLGFATLGVLHFSIVVVAWALAVWGADLNSAYVWGYVLKCAWPIPLLFAACIMSFRQAWRQRRSALPLLAAAVAGSVALLVFDVYHHRYQVQIMTAGEGCGHLYCNWPEVQ